MRSNLTATGGVAAAGLPATFFRNFSIKRGRWGGGFAAYQAGYDNAETTEHADIDLACDCRHCISTYWRGVADGFAMMQAKIDMIKEIRQ